MQSVTFDMWTRTGIAESLYHTQPLSQRACLVWIIGNNTKIEISRNLMQKVKIKISRNLIKKSKQWQNYNVNEQKGANMTGIAPKSQYGPDLIDLSNLTRLFSVFEMYFILFLACFCTKETSSKFK
eukprot:32949_1